MIKYQCIFWIDPGDSIPKQIEFFQTNENVKKPDG